MAEILISNLFLNSIKHNIDNGFVLIVLTETSLMFSNTGNETSLENNKLYHRFSKINPSTHGNGLGLAIIKKIADLNDWSISYNFENKQHLFTINFNNGEK